MKITRYQCDSCGKEMRASDVFVVRKQAGSEWGWHLCGGERDAAESTYHLCSMACGKDWDKATEKARQAGVVK